MPKLLCPPRQVPIGPFLEVSRLSWNLLFWSSGLYLITCPPPILGLYALTGSAAAVDVFIFQQVFLGKHSVQESTAPSWSIHNHMKKLFQTHPEVSQIVMHHCAVFPVPELLNFLLRTRAWGLLEVKAWSTCCSSPRFIADTMRFLSKALTFDP